MSEKSEKYLTVSEFAEAIKVHPQTVRNWDRTGKLRPHHIMPSGRRLYDQSQVDAYLNCFNIGTNNNDEA